MRIDVKVPSQVRVVTTRRFRMAGAGVAAASLALACSETQGPSQTPIHPGAFIVSSPVQPLEPAVTVRSTGATFEPTVVYVSLPPGSIPKGFIATIRDLRSDSSVTAQMVNGGFDPVALPAVEGDTIAIAVQITAATSPLSFRVLASASKRPVVVRTNPPTHKRDVTLNSIVVIVFSEPLDSRTVDTGSVKLWRGTTPVAGTVLFADAVHLRVEFHPDALLAKQTDYQLVVTESIRDVNGQALDSAVTVSFTTGTSDPPTNLAFASVSAGWIHTCGVTTRGAAYCWGDNQVGELGDGTTASSTIPVPVAGGLTFATLSVGTPQQTCGVTTGGAVYCWGMGGDGSIPFDSPTPVLVAGGLSFAAVSLDVVSTCGLTTTGAAYCWGTSSNGALGLGPGAGPVITTPTAVVGGLTFASVSHHGVTCGVSTASAAYCWGPNTYGGLGLGTSGPEQCPPGPALDCSTSPVAVAGGLTFAAVGAGWGHACGVTTTGTAYCWGDNDNDIFGLGMERGPELCPQIPGTIGPGSNNPDSLFVPCSQVPVEVPGLPTLVSLSVSDFYACGLTSTGAAYCWGLRPYRNGLGVTTAAGAVGGRVTFATLSTGAGHACGVDTAGVAYCWGIGDFGELGNGSTVSSTVPVKVAGQP